MKRFALIFIISIALVNCNNTSEKKISQMDRQEPVETINGGEAAQENGFVITPVEHASMVLNWDGTIIYVDPVGGKDVYNNYSEADMILVTDIHGDHMDIPTLEAIVTYKTVVFA